MKKVISILLCLMLLPLGAAQAKTFSYTIPALMARQLRSNSSLRVSVTAEASGSAPAGVDAQLWEGLKAALPALSMSGTYMLQKSSGDMQVTAQLKKGENVLSALTLLGQTTDYLLESDLLPGLLLASPRNTNALVHLLSSPNEGEWPSLGRLLSAVESAGEEFKGQLDSALEPHLNKMNAWLQGYTDIEMRTGALVQTVRVPAEALKVQTKQLLKDLYADEELLTLLRQAAAPEDAQAYLEDGMLPLFESAVDAVSFAGEMVIVRSYDALGNLSSETYDVPFASGTGIAQMQLNVTHGDSKMLTAHVQLASGLGLHVTAHVQGSLISGEATLTSAQQTTFAARYQLAVQAGTETYDETRKNKERALTHSAVLILEPMDGQTFSAQQLSATVELLAGASSTKPGYCNITLQWRELYSDAAFTLHLKNNTGSALKLSARDAGSAVRLENLSVPDLREWLSDTAQSVKTRLNELFGQCLTAE